MHLTTLLITGGHPTPALAVFDELQCSFPHIKVVFAGRRYASSSESNDTFEYQEVIKRGITFWNCQFTRGGRGIARLPKSLYEAHLLLKAVRPHAVLSFGGYIAIPIACMAWLMRIPIFTHEQTLKKGSANRLISLFAQKVLVSFPSQVSSTACVYTGNPVRKQIVNPPHALPEFADLREPILLISGGNLGSHSLNTHIFAILHTLVQSFTVVHQTGNIEASDDHGQAMRMQSLLDQPHRDRYIPLTHLSTDLWAYMLHRADVLVSRSGANTLFEVIATQTPSVMVPLPWSAYGEQKAHALLLEGAGAAEIFYQDAPSFRLLELIQKVHTNRSQYKDNCRTLISLYVADAAKKIIQTIVES